MASLTIPEVVALLRARTPQAQAAAIQIYAEAFVEYQAAAENIADLGTVVAHPKTGAPIENPYLRIRERSILTMERVSYRARLDVEGLWRQVDDSGTETQRAETESA